MHDTVHSPVKETLGSIGLGGYDVYWDRWTVSTELAIAGYPMRQEAGHK